ncbi:hypothetical protein FNV43_RR08709 [Rhamnella rubrinervis]|uniref:Cyclic nucleotide-binding domain-containing protein n=1 Tax=Rhamnella rubrinervis TaxID=2594499 RepID=A0A8K0H931_9ROSA|nr:hypothetical protein FNV43_RR08709 [Rhamnella rubrinervis]
MMMWNKIFALVCVAALSLDPLFIYVQIINEDKKCLEMDKAMGNTAVVLRLLTDLIYIGDIVLNVTEACKALKEKESWKRGKLLGIALEIWKDSWLVLFVDFLATIPIPQGSRSLNERNFLDFLLLSQYVPRFFRIYLSAKELTRAWDTLITGTVWIRGAINFFLYVLASHTYMQLATTRSEEIRRKMKLKDLEIELWIYENGLSKEMKKKIMDIVKDRLKENKDVDVKNLLDILPSEWRSCIKRLICFTTLRKKINSFSTHLYQKPIQSMFESDFAPSSHPPFLHVKIFKDIDGQVLDAICDHLKPVGYAENTHIIREGDPLDQMLFITEGTVCVYKASSHGGRSKSTKRLKGDYYGEELVKRSLMHPSLSDFPISMVNVKSHTKVEALALRAEDLMEVASTFWWLFWRNLSGLYSAYPNLLAISAVVSVWRRQITRQITGPITEQITEQVTGPITEPITRRKKPVALRRIDDAVEKLQGIGFQSIKALRRLNKR